MCIVIRNVADCFKYGAIIKDSVIFEATAGNLMLNTCPVWLTAKIGLIIWLKALDMAQIIEG